MKAIAIDIGSSFVKFALFDLIKCTIITQHKVPPPPKLSNSDPNIFEISAESLYGIVKDVIDGWAAANADLQGILLSTQMHGFVYGAGTGNDVYVSWQDMRCLHKMPSGDLTYMEYLQQLFPPEEMESCGVNIKPSLGLCNLYAMFAEEPELMRSGTLYTLGSYIISRLTGNNVCHPSNAAPLGLVNVKEMEWRRDILRKAGLSEISLPRLTKDDFEVCGYYRTCGRTLPVFPDYGDHQVAVLGSMPKAEDGIINIATGCQVSRIINRFSPGPFEIRPYFSGQYLSCISNMPAGRGLDVLVHFLKGTVAEITGAEVSVPDVWKAIQNGFVSDSRGIEVDMGFYATPDNLNGGSISGITQSNLNLRSLFSAAFFNMAEIYKTNMEILCRESPISSVVCSGGVSWKTPELLMVIRDVMKLPCRLSAIHDEALSGLFRMALCCLGVCNGLDDRPDFILKLEGN